MSFLKCDFCTTLINSDNDPDCFVDTDKGEMAVCEECRTCPECGAMSPDDCPNDDRCIFVFPWE